MNTSLYSSLFLILIFTCDLTAQNTDIIYGKPIYTFVKNEKDLEFKGEFKIPTAPLDSLLMLYFKYKHISQLETKTTELELIYEQDQCNCIKYTYKNCINYQNISVWQRQINKEQHMVCFKLISSENNSSLLPKIHSSEGYYKIIPNQGFITIEFYHHCILEKQTYNPLYKGIAHQEGKQNLQAISDYTMQYINNLNATYCSHRNQ